MAYSASSKLNGVRVVNNFISKYINYGGVITFDELINKIVRYDHDKFLQILGTAFENLNSDSDKLERAMDSLASKSIASKGLPTTGSFLSSLSEQSTTTFEIYKEALSAAFDDGSQRLADFGESALFTTKLVTWLLPIGVIAALYVIGKSYTAKLSAK